MGFFTYYKHLLMFFTVLNIFNGRNTFLLNIQFSYCSDYKRIPIKKDEQSVNISQVDENIRQIC